MDVCSPRPIVRSVRALLALAVLVTAVMQISPAFASTVTAAGFTGGSGTVLVGSTLYAKSGGALTLTVSTSSDTKCVQVTGAHTAQQTSSTAKSSWSFTFSAGAGNGVQTVTAEARPSFNANNCTGQPGTLQSSYVLDNSGPVVSGALSPAPNGNGWHRSDVTITWSAVDAGSGVATGPAPASHSITADTAGLTRTATATDRLDNAGNGSASVKLDETVPTITGSRSPAPNANGWNKTPVTVSFTCADGLSGIASCPGSTIVSTNGSNQSVSGTATDTAGNTASTTVGGIDIDTVAPQLSGAATTVPNANGWYAGDVAIAWTCGDALSGIDGPCPSDSSLTGEGTGLTASASVADEAGNATTAASAPAVNIDRTAPVTTATAPTGWTSAGVTLELTPSDTLSGVDQTHYAVDGGVVQVGTSVPIDAEGEHTVEFWSTDRAGNEEAHQSVQVLIDRSAPSISHTIAPEANTNGWHMSDVTVTFICEDTVSGIASCTEPQQVSTQGASQSVLGAAADEAGNTATDSALVSIDLTAPSITGVVDREPNASGWYDDDVTVSFSCSDALSGLANCADPQVIGEGNDGSATGTAKDAAGNEASATVDGIDIDRTKPSLSGAATPEPNAHGWYAGDVVVAWTCDDLLSGIDGVCPADSTVTGEGNDLSATAQAADLAGNTRTRTVSGIKIDRTAPSTTASVPDPLESGWYAGAVQVDLSSGPDLSGVAATYYRVDDGAAQAYTGPFQHSLTGEHSITFWSEDLAGNLEDEHAPGHALTLKIDGNPPTITGSRTPPANVFGWNDGPVTVDFLCDDAESGIAACSPSAMLTNEGPGQSVTGVALDNAGNTDGTTVDGINIDLTAPNLAGAATPTPNAYGWYRDDVTVAWTAQDGLSGIDASTLLADSVVTGEGVGLSAGPVSVLDRAGNEGSGFLTGIKIDRAAPAIAGSIVHDDGAPRSANMAGWFNGPVRVRFACDDHLSGVQACADDQVLLDDGEGQRVSGEATDRAGNIASTSVTGIDIDSQPPVTTAALSCTGLNDYCTDDATVTLTAIDQTGLSGVREIRYRIGSGPEQTTAGASATVSVPLSGSGEATVRFFAVDEAGNEETEGGVQIDYDTIAPTVSHELTPAPNAAGWNRDDVTVHFEATDDVGGAGVDATTVTPDVDLTTETAGTTVHGEAYDMAGNRGTASVEVKLDETAPEIEGAPTTSPNGHGWYRNAVTVRFDCSDDLSQIATCPGDAVLSTDGAAQSVQGTAVDVAGNDRSTTVADINLDTTDPSIAVHGVVDGGVYELGSVPASTCSASDAGGSGIDGACTMSVSGGLANGVGAYSFTASATDRAGNVEVVTGSFRAVYDFSGFLQPINDTAHQVGTGVSIFKAGSTVPVKFRLQTTSGAVIQTTTAPMWLAPSQGGALTAPVDETVYSATPMGGGSYRWDASGQQYIYNWGTSKLQANRFWRIGVQLDDGNTYFVNIGLR